MSWWIWVLIAFAILALEMTAATLHVGFFAVGALVVALLVAFGVDMPLWAELVIFTVVSLVAFFFLRPILVRKLKLDTLDAGFHILVPFVDVIRYRHSLKEMRARHPGAGLHHARQRAGRRRRRALSEGPEPRARVVRHLRLLFAISSSRRRRCAARSARSISTARSRSAPTSTPGRQRARQGVGAWGVKVLRYEIKNITPPHDILAAMEKQMRAEREKRAVILTSEGSATPRSTPPKARSSR
jgi:regulator of protease activity HflC (stomatin/prohibitin superfamily)